jgi:hypothetical protein
MLQSGGGTDGYYSDAANNMLGKVPVYGMNPCVQRGGNATQQYGETSYSAGYGFYPNYSAAVGVPFMATVPYGNSCMGGSRKGGSRKDVSRKDSRKQRNTRSRK